jgi:hypothetical protein
MKKVAKKKLTLSKETIASLEAGKLKEALGDGIGRPALSDRWQETTCL